MNPNETRQMIWLDYNGYKLANKQSELTLAQTIFLTKGHSDLYEEMNKVD